MWSSSEDSELLMQGAQVPSLVRELDLTPHNQKLLRATAKTEDPECCQDSVQIKFFFKDSKALVDFIAIPLEHFKSPKVF